jgi:hypothetical protein
MEHIFVVARLWIIRVTIFSLLAAVMSVSAAQAETASYQLDNVLLADGTQMTGAFNWAYTIGDFEGGSGVFTALEIPWNPNGAAPPLEQAGMVFTIEDKQIEISLDGNFHDYGLDISLKFKQPLSPTQSSLIDTDTSFFECCGNGFKDQPFSSGSISLVTPVDAVIEVIGPPLHVHHQGQGALPDDAVPVVVMGASTLVGDPVDLDATLIDPASLRFGASQAMVDPASTPDLNYNHDNDGIPDAKFEFRMSDTGFSATPCSASPATLVGESAGQPFTGTDTSVTTDCDFQCH